MTGKKKMAALRKVTVAVRVTQEERSLLTRAAERNALTLSAWLRSLAVNEARRVLASAK
jgi:uncharacterized protein (DUF1778 family)